MGGYFGGYYQVAIDLENNKVNWTHGGRGELEEMMDKNIRTATAKKFVEQLEIMELLDWDAEYVEHGVCDGTQWQVEIITEGNTITKNGNNSYPEQRRKFCQTISKMTRKPFS